MRFKYIALLGLTVSSSLLSCTLGNYTPNKYYSLYTYGDYHANSIMNTGACPVSGVSKVLVVPIWFTDSGDFIDLDKKESVRNDIEKAYFGTEEESGWHSVSSYYDLDSFGKVHIDGVVTPWYEIDKASTYYYKDYEEGDTEGRTEALLKNSVKWYKNLIGDTALKDFDADSNGYLDGVVLIYAAPDSSNLPGVDASNLWGYTSWLTNTLPNYIKPSIKNFFWASYDFMYDEDTAEIRTGNSYHRGDNSHNNIDAHCFIHEMGHCFGLPDFYDYRYANSFAGGFSMQDSNVGAHDAFSRYSLGWVSPYNVTNSCKIKVGAMEQTGECVLLAPSFTKTCFDEYILIELYTPERLNEIDAKYAYRGNYPSGLLKPAARFWHVDARLLKYTSRGSYQGVTTDASEPYLYPATNNDTDSQQSINPAYHVLTLLRNDVYASYEYGSDVVESDLFYEGDTFSLNKFSNQFARKTKFNNGKHFTWSVKIEELNSEYMVLNITK